MSPLPHATFAAAPWWSDVSESPPPSPGTPDAKRSRKAGSAVPVVVPPIATTPPTRPAPTQAPPRPTKPPLRSPKLDGKVARKPAAAKRPKSAAPSKSADPNAAAMTEEEVERQRAAARERHARWQRERRAAALPPPVEGMPLRPHYQGPPIKFRRNTKRRAHLTREAREQALIDVTWLQSQPRCVWLEYVERVGREERNRVAALAAGTGAAAERAAAQQRDALRQNGKPRKHSARMEAFGIVARHYGVDRASIKNIVKITKSRGSVNPPLRGGGPPGGKSRVAARKSKSKSAAGGGGGAVVPAPAPGEACAMEQVAAP